MKQFKRRLAAFLAVLLIVPTLPVRAEEVPQETVQTEEAVVEDTAVQETVESEAAEETAVEAPAGQVQTENATVEEAVGQENSENAEQVWFNTGNLEISVIAESVSDNEAYQEQWTDFFAADGSYTINIPEANPYFPYEVQFTCNGEARNEWFMNPQDSVEVGGHTFYVSAYFDDTAVTQMSLKVGGQEVIVYPEEKEFTNDGDGAAEMSLLPLRERNLTVDLTGFTPVELTMVSIDSIFTGSEMLPVTSKVAWKPSSEVAYDIYQTWDKLNLMKEYSYYSSLSAWNWDMFVGSADQLDMTDIKYHVQIKQNVSWKWLEPVVYMQDSSGNRIKQNKSEIKSFLRGAYFNSLLVDFEKSDINNTSDGEYYFSFHINENVYPNAAYKKIRVFSGMWESAEELAGATEITDEFFSEDMTRLNAGVRAYYPSVTLVTYDELDIVTGCLPLWISCSASSPNITPSNPSDPSKKSTGRISFWFLAQTDGEGEYYTVSDSYRYEDKEDVDTCEIQTLYAGYKANELYSLKGWYYSDDTAFSLNNDAVTATYVGIYDSIASANAAGAENIRAKFFSYQDDSSYVADFSQGVYFTVFVGEDEAETQEIYTCYFKVEEGTEISHDLDAESAVMFTGLKSADGTDIPALYIEKENDSYGEYNYHMILVPNGTDLTHVAPYFSVTPGAKLYASGGNTPEVSGESYHDLSNGIMQYTATMANGVEAKNYWLQIITAEEGENLFISSLKDESAHTRFENGIIYSDREVLMDKYHGEYHDIFLANIGIEKITNLKAELVSDVVEMDKYYTLSGNFDLNGFGNTSGNSIANAENMAKIRLLKKDGVEDGTDVTGTLTIKSGDTVLMVLNLTGTIGNPSIVTKEIPAAVKFVPYGTVIQNSNKYSKNQVTYELDSGELPEGIELKKNGELYGVPKEAGEYTFKVKTSNSFYGFQNEHDYATYTLMVEENTDENVEKATDTGYELKERVSNVSAGMSDSRLMVSEGAYSEFQDVYLDGRKLSEGTDYTSESGSTRITLLANTLTNVDPSLQSHTLAIEFRTKDTDTLKRAAQNYTIGSNDSNDNGSDDSGEDSENNSGNAGATSVIDAAKASSGTTETITYTVMPGDTLGKIAAKYFGNANMWRKIYADNGDVIKNPDKIRVGQKLRIILEVQAAGKEETSNAGSVSNANYVVQAGDTLWKIAKKAYGQGYYWKKVYEANQKVISNPGSIRVGQNLYIPAL